MWRLMQQQNEQNDKIFPRIMLYPQLSRVHNAGVKGGATVDSATSSVGKLISGECTGHLQHMSRATHQLLP